MRKICQVHQIEMTSRCNLRCVYCPSRSLPRPKVDFWNRGHYGAWNLHGHSHGNLLPEIWGQLDVGVDTNSLAPYTYADVVAKMALKPLYVPADHHVVM